jgi:hypothetical protein
MEFHNPTDVQSVPTVDALHVITKRHNEEVDKLKRQVTELTDILSASRTTVQEHESKLKELDMDQIQYIEQDDLQADFTDLKAKFVTCMNNVRADIGLIVDMEYHDNLCLYDNNNMCADDMELLSGAFTALCEKLQDYGFQYKFNVTGTCKFSIQDIEASTEDEAMELGREMVMEGFHNGEVCADDATVDEVDKQ